MPTIFWSASFMMVALISSLSLFIFMFLLSFHCFTAGFAHNMWDWTATGCRSAFVCCFTLTHDVFTRILIIRFFLLLAWSRTANRIRAHCRFGWRMRPNCCTSWSRMLTSADALLWRKTSWLKPFRWLSPFLLIVSRWNSARLCWFFSNQELKKVCSFALLCYDVKRLRIM